MVWAAMEYLHIVTCVPNSKCGPELSVDRKPFNDGNLLKRSSWKALMSLSWSLLLGNTVLFDIFSITLWNVTHTLSISESSSFLLLCIVVLLSVSSTMFNSDTAAIINCAVGISSAQPLMQQINLAFLYWDQ